MSSLERRWNYELGQRDARIAELEAKVELLREAQDSACKAKDDIIERLGAALSQRDRLAQALEALNKATRGAIFPESVRLVIRGENWRRLWESIDGAEAVLAELEEER